MIYVSRRLIITCLLLLIACVMAGVWGLRSGAVTLETSQVFAALMGDTPRSMTMVVTEWRLPRVLSVFRNGANSGFVECRIAQWPDVGKNLAFRTHHYINVNCRRLAGAANALAGNGR